MQTQIRITCIACGQRVRINQEIIDEYGAYCKQCREGLTEMKECRDCGQKFPVQVNKTRTSDYCPKCRKERIVLGRKPGGISKNAPDRNLDHNSNIGISSFYIPNTWFKNDTSLYDNFQGLPQDENTAALVNPAM